jgi:hypothetical protein
MGRSRALRDHMGLARHSRKKAGARDESQDHRLCGLRHKMLFNGNANLPILSTYLIAETHYG